MLATAVERIRNTILLAENKAQETYLHDREEKKWQDLKKTIRQCFRFKKEVQHDAHNDVRDYRVQN